MEQGFEHAPRLTVLVVSLALTVLSACGDAPTMPSRPPAPSGSFTIRGSVRELLPGGLGAPIEGVQVRVLYKGGEAGGSAVSDAEGSYRIDDVVSAYFQLQASRDGFESSTRAIEPLVNDATLDLTLVPILRTLVGIVTEAPPTEATPIAGAKVQILTGTNKGRSATTDAAGYYSLPNVWGTFEVSVVADGYEARTLRANIDAQVTRANVTLTPDVGPVRTTFTGSLCASNRPSYLPPWFQTCRTQDPMQAHYWFAIHRAGVVLLDAQFLASGDYYTEYFHFEMRCGPAPLWGSRLRGADGWIRTGPVSVTVTEPCLVEVKAFNYESAYKSGNNYPAKYRIDIDHPR